MASVSLMSAAAPDSVDLLSYLDRLQLRFDSTASLVAMDAHDDPATLEWSCRAVLPLWEPDDEEAAANNSRLLSVGMWLERRSGDECDELTTFAMSGVNLDLWRIGSTYDSLTHATRTTSTSLRSSTGRGTLVSILTSNNVW